MPAILQQASGTFNGSSFTPTLPAVSSAANRVVCCVAANTVITTPAGFTLRTSQVNQMGHYLIDRAGNGVAGYPISASAGQGTWWIGEIAAGVFDTAQSANAATGSGFYATPNVTPTSGTRLILASVASLAAGGIRTVSGWTNSFVEQADVSYSGADNPMQGFAIIEVTANGTTAYSTGATYSATSTGRSAIIASYGYTDPGGGPAYDPTQMMPAFHVM